MSNGLFSTEAIDAVIRSAMAVQHLHVTVSRAIERFGLEAEAATGWGRSLVNRRVRRAALHSMTSSLGHLHSMSALTELTPRSGNPRWFALWTHSHSEQLVHDQLASKGFSPLLPKRRTPRSESPNKWNGWPRGGRVSRRGPAPDRAPIAAPAFPSSLPGTLPAGLSGLSPIDVRSSVSRFHFAVAVSKRPFFTKSRRGRQCKVEK